MATPILNIAELANGQTDQYLTANEAFRLLEAAGNDYETVDLSTSDAALTSGQLVQHAMFMTSGNTVARTLTVPASKRLFLVSNGGSAELTVAVGATNIAVGAGTAGLFYADGTPDGLISIAGGGGGGDVQSVNGQTGVVVIDIREILTSPRTYYVRTDGSDANDGLTDTAGGAFLTLQKAVDVAATLDTSVYNVTIKIAAGLYDLGEAGVELKSALGSGSIIIEGDITTPANVELSLSGSLTGRKIVLGGVGLSTLYVIRGVKVSSTTAGTSFGIVASGGTQIDFSDCDFGGGLTQHLRAENYGILRAVGNYTISGGAQRHWEATGALIRVQAATITITGTPTFDAFAVSTGNSLVIVNGNTFVGNATGNRYVANFGGAIQVNGAGETYLPGDVNGIVDNGGIYA